MEVGTWDTTTATFTPGGRPNAVRVTARRTVPALLGQPIGVNPTTLTCRAVAKYNVLGYGLVGLNGISLSGNATASYASGTPGAPNGYGNIGSNGNITLGGNSSVNGDVYYGPGKSVSGGSVSGNKTVLSAPLSYPNGDSGVYSPTNNDNANIPSWAISNGSALKLTSGQSLVLPGGNYYFSSFNMAGGSSLSFTGPATIYCYTNFIMSGNTQTSGAAPGNLKLVMVPNPYGGSPPGFVSIGGSAAFYGSIYAPQSDVTLSGTGDIYGSVLGLTVSMTGTSGIHYDLSLDSNNGAISLVQ